MAVQPDTTSGTLTTIAGSINFTTSGTNLLTREHLPGDRFLVNGLELQIATITSENTGTLTEVCPASAAVSGYPVRLRFQPDGARVAAQTRNLIDLIGNGTLQSLADLDGNADELIGFLGPNTLTTFNRTDLIQGADYDVQVDTLAGRDAYNNRPANYSVLVSDAGDGRAAIYVKRSDTDGDWSNPAYVTGAIGAMPTLEAGPTTTVSPTTPANVTVTPNGSGGYTLNFSIPQGFQGAQGIQGEQGEQGNGLEIDAVGSLADRATYNSQPEGFTFFDTENGNLYFRVGAAGNWSDPVSFQGPPGDDGALITTTSGTGNGTTGPYTLDATPLNSDSVWVTISGVEQYDYIISGNQITFGLSIPNGVPWRVKTSGPLPVGTAQAVDNGIITANSLTDDETELEAIRDKIGAGTGSFDGVPLGAVLMQNGSVDPGFIRIGEGGTYDRAVLTDLATWMDANGATAFGLSPTQIANGELPLWSDYSPRTAGGTLGPAVGAKQEDAFQGHWHDFYQGAEEAATGSGRFSGGAGVAAGTTAFSNRVRNAISDGTNGTPRIATETRVKSFGVRWQIKAFGVITDPGTIDIVALQQAVAGAIRFDQDQSAQSSSEARKINIVKNTLQGYEKIGETINLAGLSTFLWSGLGSYRKIRIECWYAPSATSPGDGLFIRVGNDSTIYTTYFGMVDNRYNGDSSITSAQSTSDTLPGFIAADVSPIYGGSFTMEIDEFNKNELSYTKTFIREHSNGASFGWATRDHYCSVSTPFTRLQCRTFNNGTINRGHITIFGMRG